MVVYGAHRLHVLLRYMLLLLLLLLLWLWLWRWCH